MYNITIGQYIPGNSWLHKLDPRFKIASLIMLLVGVFILPISSNLTPLYVLVGFLALAILLIISSQVPIGKVLNGLRPIVFLLTFTVIVQILYVRVGTPLFETPIRFYLSISSLVSIFMWLVIYNLLKRFIKFKVTFFFISIVMIFLLQNLLPYGNLFYYDVLVYDVSLIRALFIFLRISVVIMLTSLLTFTTMTTDLNYGLEKLMGPLKVIKVPVDVITMMISLTLRFIPTLLVETDKIMKAQASRGVDFKESKFKEKVNQIISLLVPVFVISFKRSEDLANAMEVRGYVIGHERTRVDVYPLKVIDIMSFIASILILVFVIGMIFI